MCFGYSVPSSHSCFLLPVPHCAYTATMVAHSKGAVPKKADLVKKPSQSSLGNQAVGFRNLMKYRASEVCKKAWAVWGSRGPISHIARIQ